VGEKLKSTTNVGKRDGDVAIETAGTSEGTRQARDEGDILNTGIRSTNGSRLWGKFVAAMTMTPSVCKKPSISTSNWLRVCFM
jgi:hypothetical protein